MLPANPRDVAQPGEHSIAQPYAERMDHALSPCRVCQAPDPKTRSALRCQGEEMIGAADNTDNMTVGDDWKPLHAVTLHHLSVTYMHPRDDRLGQPQFNFLKTQINLYFGSNLSDPHWG